MVKVKTQQSLAFSTFMLSSFLSIGMEPSKDDIVLKGIVNNSNKRIHLHFGSILNPSLYVDLEPGENQFLNYTISKNSRGKYPIYEWSADTSAKDIEAGKAPNLSRVIHGIPQGKYKNFILLFDVVGRGALDVHEITASE